MRLQGGINQQSAIRSINRGLEQYKRYFGEDSQEYITLCDDMKLLLGEPDYTQKSGAIGYSRSKNKKYNDDRLIMAKDLVTGKNTAAQRWNAKIIEEAQQSKEWKDIENEVSQYYSAIYQYIKDNPDEFDYDSAEIISKFVGLNNDSKKDLVDNIKENFNMDTVDKIRDLIQKSKKYKSDIENGLKSRASKTRKTKRMTRNEARQFEKRR